MSNEIIKSTEQQFGEVVDIILHHKSRATKAVNEELLLTAWQVGGYVSAKLKSEEWPKIAKAQATSSTSAQKACARLDTAMQSRCSSCTSINLSKQRNKQLNIRSMYIRRL